MAEKGLPYTSYQQLVSAKGSWASHQTCLQIIRSRNTGKFTMTLSSKDGDSRAVLLHGQTSLSSKENNVPSVATTHNTHVHRNGMGNCEEEQVLTKDETDDRTDDPRMLRMHRDNPGKT